MIKNLCDIANFALNVMFAVSMMAFAGAIVCSVVCAICEVAFEKKAVEKMKIEKSNGELLEEVEERVKKKLEQKKKSFGYSGKRGEGYEEAVSSILSIIHELKEKYK